MDFSFHVDAKLAIAIIALFLRIRYVLAMRKRPKAKPAVSQRALAAVCALTGTEPPCGEDLLGLPELRRELAEAKAKDKARREGR